MTAQLIGPDYDLADKVPGNLAELISDHIARLPNASLIELTLEDGQIQNTYAQLFSRACSLCEKLNTTSQDTPLILAFDRASDFIPAAWAATFIGRWYIPWQITQPATPSNAYSARLKLLQQCFPSARLITTGELAPLANSMLDQRPDWSHLVVNATGCSGKLPESNVPSGYFITTSGTSGGAKFARIHNQTLYYRLQAMQAPTDSRVSLTCFPFDSVTGHNIILPTPGTRIFLHTNRLMSRPSDLPTLIEQHQINSLGLSMTMLAKLVQALDNPSPSRTLTSLRSVSFGAEPLSKNLIRIFVDKSSHAGAGDFSVSLGYGMTETGPITGVAFSTPEEALVHLGEQAEGSVRLGDCTRFTALRITDERDRPLPLGEKGEIQIHSIHRLFDGYQTATGLDRSCFTDDGWFRTGDIGVIDSGQLAVLGRKSGSMSVAGRTVSLEQIETQLQVFNGLEPGTLVAAAVHTDPAIRDELALFYTADRNSNIQPLQLGDNLRLAVTRLIGISPRHLIPLPVGYITRTASAKVIRPQLVSAFKNGRLQPLTHVSEEIRPASDVRDRVKQIWAQQLKIAPLIPDNADFFELGADSLAVAEMIHTVEREFDTRLPLEQFFQQPSVANLVTLLGTSNTCRSEPGGAENNRTRDDIRKLETSYASWPTEIGNQSSRIPGRNAAGSATPIIWVFQNAVEFSGLAAALGKQYPLYGLRSLVEIRQIPDYDADILDAACDFYVPKIYKRLTDKPYILGGNCQGGIVALALARRLRRMGRAPQSLVLMEWSFSYGAYDDKVELLYGSESHKAEFYTGECADGWNWRRDFSNGCVNPIDGKHGEFFLEENVNSLAAQIQRICHHNEHSARKTDAISQS